MTENKRFRIEISDRHTGGACYRNGPGGLFNSVQNSHNFIFQAVGKHLICARSRLRENCERYGGGKWYVFQELSCQFGKKKKDELKQIMNQKVIIFLLCCSSKCILRTKESKCLESRRD